MSLAIDRTTMIIIMLVVALVMVTIGFAFSGGWNSALSAIFGSFGWMK